ncbi:GNAT family N-acetyltransferase [Apilactobacillus micheneri]|uniref:GNAT family N-acetyltransferase n=1 Tax=Apilactobacillus micheneri TaxID=1899430 RepID=A0ABY2YW48_9LACO|nr:GNAT family N-acetyltransferase [Apilactobacillus micheneri]TPR24288.1 GNAT family N-acetyltransferase [Apilactobacillus micheneri]TPR25307.1 GNAT family N-acetyltransferase [Apilactobacillus micheneri]TPR27619.1 GNAT family N-acetyltransferase [Apilactobacillus micheneri]TPR28884.1 GNAT family N-acetyltransferase [Apilactobacillus micheneri]TPR29906.1 GNAT family N-acetyltransferase [Apilactobacillus micheneri]
MIIRLFKYEDAKEVSNLVSKTMMTNNIKDYDIDYLRKDIGERTPKFFIDRSKYLHCYICLINNKIVGTGSIGPYWGKSDESSLFNIFVDPEFQGKGIGKTIINTLENDIYFKRAKRVEIPSSITALNFYRTMGYDFKNNNNKLDDERLFRLEKFNYK